MQVAVIGAGIIGLAVAHRLAGQGHDVTVIAPDEAHRASTGNAGTIAGYAVDPVGTPGVLRDLPSLLFSRTSPLAIHRPSALSLVPWLTRFVRQSLPGAAQANRLALAGLLQGADDLWRELADSVGAAGLLRDTGAVYAYDTPEAVASALPGIDRRRSLGVTVETLSAQALRDLEPALPEGRFAGGALFPGTLWLTDPARMLDHLATTPRIVARVTGIERRGAGWHLRTDAGEHHAEAVVLAAGAWSARLLAPLGLRIPLTAERGYHLEYDLPEDLLRRPVCPVSRGFYLVPMAGRLRAAGTVELGGIGAPPSAHRWERLDQGVRSVFPDLPPASRRWMGLRPSIPDSVPVIGRVAPGLVAAFGHGHIGLTLAPRTALLVEEALAGGDLPAAVGVRRF